MEKLTTRIFGRLANDISDRRGLKQEWERIDPDTMADLKQTWSAIMVEEIVEFNKKEWETFKKELKIELHGS